MLTCKIYVINTIVSERLIHNMKKENNKIELDVSDVENAVKMYIESKYRYPEFQYKDIKTYNVWPCSVLLEK